MKLSLDSVLNGKWNDDYTLPKYNLPLMIEETKYSPRWLHIGAGNIFRGFIAALQDDLINDNPNETGIIVYETFDKEIISTTFEPHDNLALGVTLFADGSTKKRVIGSVAKAFSNDFKEVCKIIAMPWLQLISLTITENGYYVNPETVCEYFTDSTTTMEQITAGLYYRSQIRSPRKSPPIALVSMDNFAENGTKLFKAILTIAEVWEKSGCVTSDFIDYIKSLSFPWTMIDKITPRPSEDVAELLKKDGFKDTQITKTSKNTFIAPFVNAESSQYLIIEDDFPNGRPPFEKAGVYMTDKETVRNMDSMKVCACLNPLHTILAVTGMLLSIPTISECMKDQRIVKLLRLAADEALPTVKHPGIINPEDFLEEVLKERFPNPFIPDTPSRIACDTSQKIPIRFGVMLNERNKKGLPEDSLKAFPLFAALWLRYRTGINDKGEPFDISPDPLLPQAYNKLKNLPFGEKPDLKDILSDSKTFGINLYDSNLASKVEDMFIKLSASKGAVDRIISEVL